VFFKFFNVQSKGIKEFKKKTDLVKFEMQRFQKNPHFNDRLRVYYKKKRTPN
jgi:hypothetical protein